ncbi:MAG: prolipoprotein diacylglyceryl transferase [Candidatus Berkelbacteria bacterium]|nr:prolipoprotein diacylglyceryl transferase [Candidatus Berkelbacteria bacterium]
MFAIILHPTVTIQLGYLTVFTWGLLVSIGIIVGLILIWYLSKKEGINFDHVLNLSLISIIFGFIGARLLYVFLEPSQFQNPIEIIRIWDGGLALYGGLALAIFVDIIYVKKNKLDVLKYADLFAPPLALAMAIARVGCTLVNDHLGKITSLPWGITVDRITRHPISAYEVIILFVLFIILIVFRKSFLRFKGFSAFFALTWYALFRFIIDTFEDFQGRTDIFYANQIFLLLVFIISLYFLIKILKFSHPSSS